MVCSTAMFTRVARTATRLQLAPTTTTALQLRPLQLARSAAASPRSFTTTHPTRSSLSPTTSTSPYTIGDLSTSTYRLVSDQTMDRLTEYLEELVEEMGETAQGAEMDVEYSAGVLTLNLGDTLGTYVINKQPPNKQIWLSSPLSGPKRYDYDPSHRVWFYARDGKRLKELLDEELSEKLGREVRCRVENDEV